MPKISVIIPVYNVANCLIRCLNTVIKQTYKNLEIILINDGSTDISGKICEQYALKDNRIKIIYTEHEGPSQARNIGIQNATGEYVTFIDSDDDVELDILEYLYNISKRFNCNLSICAHTIYKSKKRKKTFKLKLDEKLSSHDCIKKMLNNNGVHVSAWAKLYKKDLFNGIEYPKGHIFEDIYTTYKLIIKANSIAIGHLSKYNYRKRINSITLNSYNYTTLDLIKSTDKMGKDIIKIFPDLKEIVFRRRIYERFATLNKMLNIDKTYKNIIKRIITGINKFTCTMLIDKEISFNKKCAIIVLKINYKLYKFFAKIYIFIWKELLCQDIS